MKWSETKSELIYVVSRTIVFPGTDKTDAFGVAYYSTRAEAELHAVKEGL